MKTYNWIFFCYGQSTASRIAYHQKMGVAQGIYKMLLDIIDHRKLDLKDFTKTYEIGGHTLDTKCITAVIPSPDNFKAYCDNQYPWFSLREKRGVIDMLHYNSELQFHFMAYDYDAEVFKNDGWHTIRECLSLEDTITLYEYTEDRVEDLIILPMEEYDKYFKTGALGVGMVNKED